MSHKKNHKSYRSTISRLLQIMAVILLSATFVSCHKGSTDQLAFLNPLLVKGVNRPTPPGGLTSIYEPVTQYLCLHWNPSIDPDTNQPVPIYRIYLYFVYPPAEFFREQDLLDEQPALDYCLHTDSYTGMLTFVVTGYDGLAESLPSEPLMIQIP